jgi:Flp pilus assembly protein TadG
MRPNRKKGQAILLMLVAIGIFLIGGVGLVVDVSQLYTQQQMAQVAADAAAQAAMLGIVQGVDTIGSASIASGYTCTTGTDSYIACQYARLNGFGSNASDIVKITYPSCGLGATICGPITPNEVQVSITRTVPNTFIRFVGAGASSSIGATAIAAAIQVVAPVPILIIHPTMDG